MIEIDVGDGTLYTKCEEKGDYLVSIHKNKNTSYYYSIYLGLLGHFQEYI